MREEIISEVELDVPRHNDDRLSGKKGEQSGGKRERHDEAGPHQHVRGGERVRIDAPLEVVNGAAKKPGLHDRKHIAADDRQNAEEEDLFVAGKIWSQAKKGFHDSP